MLQDELSGLSNVWLENGYKRHDTEWGPGTSVSDPEGLCRAITLELCVSPHHLCKEGVRYLRRSLQLTQQELGEELGCTAQAIAKWEKGEVSMIPVAPARLLRLLVLKRMAPEVTLRDGLADYNESLPDKMVFSYDKEAGWRCADHEHGVVTAPVQRADIKDFVDFMPNLGSTIRVDIEAFNAFSDNDGNYGSHETKLVAA